MQFIIDGTEYEAGNLERITGVDALELLLGLALLLLRLLPDPLGLLRLERALKVGELAGPGELEVLRVASDVLLPAEEIPFLLGLQVIVQGDVQVLQLPAQSLHLCSKAVDAVND